MTKPSVLEQLGLTPVINAKGAASQLGGNLLSAAAQEAMIEAGQRFVPLQELQARASEAISRTTGAEAGCVASGAAACLFLRRRPAWQATTWLRWTACRIPPGFGTRS